MKSTLPAVAIDVDLVFNHIAAGGIIEDLALLWNQSVGAICAELQATPERSAQWKAADAKRDIVLKDQIISELVRIAFYDPRKLYSNDGLLLPVKDWPIEVARAIGAIETHEYVEGRGEDSQKVTVRKARFCDKMRALELLGKELRMFTDRKILDFGDNIAGVLKKARERVEADVKGQTVIVIPKEPEQIGTGTDQAGHVPDADPKPE